MGHGDFQRNRSIYHAVVHGAAGDTGTSPDGSGARRCHSFSASVDEDLTSFAAKQTGKGRVVRCVGEEGEIKEAL